MSGTKGGVQNFWTKMRCRGLSVQKDRGRERDKSGRDKWKADGKKEKQKKKVLA